MASWSSYNEKMIESVKKIIDLLSPHERRRALLLIVMIIVMALLDVVGVASIMPFMVVLANPQMIKTNTILATAYNTLGFTDAQTFLVFLGIAVFVLLVFSITLKAFGTYAQLRFSYMRIYSISRRIIKGYMCQPYVWFLNRNSADLGKTILTEVSEVITGAMIPLIQLIAQGSTVCAMLTLIVLVEPSITLVAASVLGITYLIVFKALSGYLARIGAERVAATRKLWETLSEAFGGIKEIKVGGLEEVYVKRLDKSLLLTVTRKTAAQIAPQIPRFILEAIVFGGMLLLILYLIVSKGGFAKAMPILSLYAFAAYRLIPSLQAVFGYLTQLRFSGSALDLLHRDIASLTPCQPVIFDSEPLRFEHSISLDNVVFTYPKASKPSLNGLRLNVPVHSTIGFVGATGSGKTTTVDLILCLLEPCGGSLKVDGVIIDANNRSQWQRTIGYVPQQIYLADDSVAANIAFGLDQDQIDLSAVERAARIANLHDFVINELPEGYATKVGERGVRISGGQRQRIGIARALYHNPKVLILDEATSALDNLTELAVMDAVHNLRKEITIILIAHRLSTVRECDKIYLMERGCVVAHGSYDELVRDNNIFRAMSVSTPKVI